MYDLEPAECAGLIKTSRAAAVLTGAGISTAAGIPDFRGPMGLYVTRRYDPEKVFDIDWFRREPRYFYEFSRDFIGLSRGGARQGKARTCRRSIVEWRTE